MKQYKNENVLEAAKERIHFLFDHFEQIYFSLSGGKDSGAMVQLAHQIAKKRNRTFDLLILDIEANYDSTRLFLEELKKLSSIKRTYHFCLPFLEDNTTSIFQPQWMMWNPLEKEKWVQPLPDDAIQVGDLDEHLAKIVDSCEKNPDKFLRMFSYWYYTKHQKTKVVCCVGIRTQESLNRYQAIIKGKKFKDQCWLNEYTPGVYNAYPLYDWKVEDVWGAYAKYDWQINSFYQCLYQMGIPLAEMRICQPYGLQQRKGLTQYAAVEPKTWERVVARVSGANFGRLYARTTLLGHYNTSKPNHMSWQEYTVFLLETMGLYSRKLQDHYYRKIKILMDYYTEKFHFPPLMMPDDSTCKQWKQDERLWHNWKGIAKALEKNDFALTTRQYSFTKQDGKELAALFYEFQDTLGVTKLPRKQQHFLIETQNKGATRHRGLGKNGLL